MFKVGLFGAAVAGFVMIGHHNWAAVVGAAAIWVVCIEWITAARPADD